MSSATEQSSKLADSTAGDRLGMAKVKRMISLQYHRGTADAMLAEITALEDRLRHARVVLDCISIMAKNASRRGIAGSPEDTYWRIRAEANDGILRIDTGVRLETFDTAPRDGSHFLAITDPESIGFGYYDGKKVPQQAVVHFFDGDFWLSSGDQGKPWVFKYWQPLPAPAVTPDHLDDSRTRMKKE